MANFLTDTNQERGLHRWLKDLYGHGMELYNVKFMLQPPSSRIPIEVANRKGLDGYPIMLV